MIIPSIRDELPEESIVFDNPSFDNSIMGFDDNNHVIYSYDDMVQELAKDDNMTEEEAAEFIEYNTLRAIPYAGENAPIVIYTVGDWVKVY